MVLRLAPDNRPTSGHAEPTTARYRRRKQLAFAIDRAGFDFWTGRAGTHPVQAEVRVRLEGAAQTLACLVLGHVPLPPEPWQLQLECCAYCQRILRPYPAGAASTSSAPTSEPHAQP